MMCVSANYNIIVTPETEACVPLLVIVSRDFFEVIYYIKNCFGKSTKKMRMEEKEKKQINS